MLSFTNWKVILINYEPVFFSKTFLLASSLMLSNFYVIIQKNFLLEIIAF